jgi:ribosomal protein S12 methylthiotransferase accessory factor
MISEEDARWTDARELLLPRLAEVGITRVAETTRIDRLGIPTMSVVRPWTRDVIWVYSGKGTSDSEAFVKATMEAIERTVSLWPEDVGELRCASIRELGYEPHLDPRCVTTLIHDITLDTPILWVPGQQLTDDAPILLPAELVFGGRMPDYASRFSVYRTGSSNGLGAGLQLEDALLHALREVIERDIVSCIELRASHAVTAFIGTAAARLGLDLGAVIEKIEDRTDVAIDVNMCTLPKSLQSLNQCFLDAGLSINIKSLPNDYNLYAYGASCEESLSWDSVLASAGYCAHEQAEVALRGALLELAQTRATDLQGAREDRHEPEKQRLREALNNHWLTSESQFMDDFPNQSCSTWKRNDYLSAIKHAGLDGATYYHFPSPPGLYVVRVVVPEAETWHPLAGRARVGARMRREFAIEDSR